MSSADLKRVNDWTELLHYTTTGMPVAGGQCTMDMATNPAKLNLTSTRLTEASATGTRIDIDKTVKAFMDLSVLTAMCDNNRVIFLKMPGNFIYRNLGLTLESHSVSHRTGNANQGGACVSNALEMVHTIDKYYAELFAYFVGRLDAFGEGEGKTVLDNTATVWFQEMSDGNSHNLNNMPILQAGSCGGYFKTGAAVNLEGAKTDMTQGSSDMDCVDMESPSNKLDYAGDAAERCLEAGQQVFLQPHERDRREGRGRRIPGQGRHRSRDEVRQVRRHEDVQAGGTAAVTIANPGEYTELRGS